MVLTRSRLSPTVNKTGAPAGAVLYGCGLHNQGVQLRVFNKQEPGRDGAITGPFLVLHAGQGIHANVLETFLQRTTTAEELLKALRTAHPACVNVANMNILMVNENLENSTARAHPSEIACHEASLYQGKSK
jgi:hypothetical protein